MMECACACLWLLLCVGGKGGKGGSNENEDNERHCRVKTVLFVKLVCLLCVLCGKQKEASKQARDGRLPPPLPALDTLHTPPHAKAIHPPPHAQQATLHLAHTSGLAASCSGLGSHLLTLAEQHHHPQPQPPQLKLQPQSQQEPRPCFIWSTR